MRILAIDAGNSRVKWGVWEDGWTLQGAVATLQVGALTQAWRNLPPIDVVVACSVAGMAVRRWLDAWCSDHNHALRWVLSVREQCGVRNGYEDPEQLGADRWVSLIAARALAAGAALVVNAGTAVTIDALDADGQFRGGLIVPGLELMASSLASGTAGLSHSAGAFEIFPKNTADAIASGAMQAVCGAIERVKRAMTASGSEPQLVLSGGGAAAIQEQLGRSILLQPTLVLDGLRIVALKEARA